MTAVPNIDDDDATDAENLAHVALFAHVCVDDPADWRTVALRLACQYAPDLLRGSEVCGSVTPAKKGGRPRTRTDWHLAMVEIFVEMVRKESRDGRIRPGLDTTIDACKFIVGKAPETQWMRDALGLKADTSPFTLANMHRDARKLNGEAHENV